MRIVLAEDDLRWQKICDENILKGLMIAFEGDLGVGKSSLIRFLMRGLGISGSIKSPTYTLCEYYNTVNDLQILHIDAYRLEKNDWSMLGLDMYEESLILVEWCSLHPFYFNKCDLVINIDIAMLSREYTITGLSSKGKILEERAVLAFST